MTATHSTHLDSALSTVEAVLDQLTDLANTATMRDVGSRDVATRPSGLIPSAPTITTPAPTTYSCPACLATVTVNIAVTQVGHRCPLKMDKWHDWKEAGR